MPRKSLSVVFIQLAEGDFLHYFIVFVCIHAMSFMDLESYFKVQLSLGPINKALNCIVPDWHSNDAAKKIYRRFNQPDRDQLHQILREAQNSDNATQQELIEKLMYNVDVEEALNELNQTVEVC